MLRLALRQLMTDSLRRNGQRAPQYEAATLHGMAMEQLESYSSISGILA